MDSNTEIKKDVSIARPKTRRDACVYELMKQLKTKKDVGDCELMTKSNFGGQEGR